MAHYKSKCSVIGCTTEVIYGKGRKQEYVLHKLPYQPERREEWLILIGRSELVDKNSREYVCGRHFSDVQYSSTLRTRLHSNAVPELYLPDPKGEKDTNGQIKIVHMPRVYEPSDYWNDPSDSPSCIRTMYFPAEENTKTTVSCPEITVLQPEKKPAPPLINLDDDDTTQINKELHSSLLKIKTYTAKKKKKCLEKTGDANILSSQDGREIYVKCEPIDMEMESNNAQCIPDLNNVPETDSSVLYNIGYTDIEPKCELAETDDHSAMSSSPGLQGLRSNFTKSADRNIKTILKEIKEKPTSSLTKDDILELVNEVTKREKYISSIEKSLVDKAVTIQQLTIENARLKKKLSSGKC